MSRDARAAFARAVFVALVERGSYALAIALVSVPS